MPKKRNNHFLRVVVATLLCLALLLYLGRQQGPPTQRGAYERHPKNSSSRNTPASCDALPLDATASIPLRQANRPLLGRCSVHMSRGYPIPDPNCTPGAINPTLTAEVLRDPDFRTSCVRGQDTSQHEKAETYDWYGIEHPHNNSGQSQTCELDHLVSLELGGADTLDNIWPECGPSDTDLRERYFKRKDLVENYLARQVKEGKIDLAVAQRGIAGDWTQYLADAGEYCKNDRCD